MVAGASRGQNLLVLSLLKLIGWKIVCATSGGGYLREGNLGNEDLNPGFSFISGSLLVVRSPTFK